MIPALNRLVDLVEEHLTEPFDVKAAARTLGTTEYHLRRMFSSLADLPLSEYVRRRRMTVAAADVIRAEEDLLEVAVRYGYGSTEAFGRAFRAVHGVGPADARRDGGPLRAQPQLRFRLTVEGTERLSARIVDRPAFRLAGYAARVPLVHSGLNPRIQQHVSALSDDDRARLRALGGTEPGGVLTVSDDLDADRTEGSELTFLVGVAVPAGAPVPAELDVIEVPAGRWVVFRTSGPHPRALQETWAATATEWFPSNPWRLRPGPEIVAVDRIAADFSTATCELWLPIEPERGQVGS